MDESPDDRDAPDPGRVEAVIHGYPCNRYKQKSRRLLVFPGEVVTPLVTPKRKMENARSFLNIQNEDFQTLECVGELGALTLHC